MCLLYLSPPRWHQSEEAMEEVGSCIKDIVVDWTCVLRCKGLGKESWRVYGLVPFRPKDLNLNIPNLSQRKSMNDVERISGLTNFSTNKRSPANFSILHCT